MVWSAKYSSFGDAAIEVETVENNLRLPGQVFDSETGLYYNYHRYYDPKIGRYLRADPIGLEGGTNLFSYCFNDPIFRMDPIGLKACEDKCSKVFTYPFWKKTGRKRYRDYFHKFFAGKCYYKIYLKYELVWFWKDVYRCESYKEKCGECVKDGRVYPKYEEKDTGRTFWSGWKHEDSYTKEPLHWDAKYRDCPGAYSGKQPEIFP